MDEKIQIEHVIFSIRKTGVLLPGKQRSRIFSASLLLPTSLLLPVVVLGMLLVMFTSCSEGNKVSVGKGGILKKKKRSFWRSRDYRCFTAGP